MRHNARFAYNIQKMQDIMKTHIADVVLGTVCFWCAHNSTQIREKKLNKLRAFETTSKTFQRQKLKGKTVPQ